MNVICIIWNCGLHFFICKLTVVLKETKHHVFLDITPNIQSHSHISTTLISTISKMKTFLTFQSLSRYRIWQLSKNIAYFYVILVDSSETSVIWVEMILILNRIWKFPKLSVAILIICCFILMIWSSPNSLQPKRSSQIAEHTTKNYVLRRNINATEKLSEFALPTLIDDLR